MYRTQNIPHGQASRSTSLPAQMYYQGQQVQPLFSTPNPHSINHYQTNMQPTPIPEPQSPYADRRFPQLRDEAEVDAELEAKNRELTLVQMEETRKQSLQQTKATQLQLNREEQEQPLDLELKKLEILARKEELAQAKLQTELMQLQLETERQKAKLELQSMELQNDINRDDLNARAGGITREILEQQVSDIRIERRLQKANLAVAEIHAEEVVKDKEVRDKVDASYATNRNRFLS